MNPSIHRAPLSLTVTSILVKTETVNYHRNTRALDCSMANISTRYSKFPGVYSPEFLNALSLLRSLVSVLLQCVCRCRVNIEKEDVRTNKEALFLIFEVHQWSLNHYTVEFKKKKKKEERKTEKQKKTSQLISGVHITTLKGASEIVWFFTTSLSSNPCKNRWTLKSFNKNRCIASPYQSIQSQSLSM